VIRIEQALHGYSQGHRLLAHSGALHSDELDQLARLSDLAGYLPTGLSFEHYVTGFPCGRFYAFASTWPDLDAPRGGAVLTHTLLIPTSNASNLVDLFALSGLHRFPAKHPSASYDQCLDWAPQDTDIPTAPSVAIKDAVALLVFGQEQRPIVWIDEGDLTPPLRWAWRLLWPTQRMTWSFCTLALQPRTLSGQPFSWLAAPPEARAGLHRLAGSKAWWEGGRLKDRKLEKRSGEPWVASFRDLTEVQRVIRRTMDAGIPSLEAHHLPLAMRFLELEEAATQRLPAARTRADFLDQMAPTFADAPSAWLRALTQLVEIQSSAPLDPRPLWELEDLLSRRPLHEALVSSDGGDLREHLIVMVLQELESRICSCPSRAVDGLPSLYPHALACRVSELVLEAASLALRRLSEASADPDLTTSIRRIVLDPEVPAELAAELIHGVSRAEQKNLLAALLDSKRAEQDLEVISARISEASLALEFGVLRGKDMITNLDVAARIYLAHPGSISDWLRLLSAARVDDAWVWSLRTAVAPQSLLEETWHWSGRHGDAMTLAELAQGQERVVEAITMAGRHLSAHALREAFRKYPELATATATATLASADSGADNVARAAVESAPKLFIFDAAFRATLEASPNSKLAQEVLRDPLLPELLRQLVGTTEQARPELRGWLIMSKVRELLSRSSSSDIKAAFGWRLPHDALGVGLATLLDLLAPDAFVEIAWSVPLLCTFLRGTNARDLQQACGRLVHISSLPLYREAKRVGGIPQSEFGSICDAQVLLFGEVLGAVRETGCLQCGSVVANVFYPVYSRLLSDSPGPLRNCGWWNSTWWDRAKSWRHWLLESAVSGDWPGLVVRAAAGNDKNLLERLERRADDDRKSREYWRRRVQAD